MQLPPLSSMQFGFELEGIAPWSSGVNSIWKAREYYTNQFARRTRLDTKCENKVSVWSPDKWLISGDSSIEREHPREIDVELKSPILAALSLRQLPDIFAKCAAAGLKTNPSCGLHLHIGRIGQDPMRAHENYQAWQPKQVVGFMETFEANIDAFHACVSPHRLTNGHCKRNARPLPYNLEWLQDAHAADSLTQRETLVELSKLYCPIIPLDENVILDGEEHGDRNYAVNLTSLFDKGTIEIKLFQADNYQNATPFIGVMLHMAQAAIDGRQFDWNGYAAAVAEDPVLALPRFLLSRPSRPRRRPRSLPAAAARQG